MLCELSGRQYNQAYRQCSMADGSEATPMASMHSPRAKRKARARGKRRAKQRTRTNQRKEHQTSRVRSVSSAGRLRPKGLSQVHDLACRKKKTAGHVPSANAIEEAGWIFALDQSLDTAGSQSDIVVAQKGGTASVHACPPKRGQENGLRQMKETRRVLLRLMLTGIPSARRCTKDSTREDNIKGRNETRLALWEEHLKDPIVALNKALKCV